MSLLDGMKDRLGFGGKPEWADDEYYDDDVMYDDEYDDYDDTGYGDSGYNDDGYGEDRYGSRRGSGTGRHRSEVIAFDSYNPNNFEHVTLSSDRKPRVASYDNLEVQRSSRGYMPRPASSYSRNASTAASRRDSTRVTGEPTWSAPSDPSFLDSPAPARQSRDPYANLGSDFLKMKGEPTGRMEIVCPTAYADIEKVANAAKAGKTVILNVQDTKASLAKRILDFSFGVASALNLNVGKAAERVFVISKSTEPLTDEDREYLIAQEVLKPEPEA